VRHRGTDGNVCATFSLRKKIPFLVSRHPGNEEGDIEPDRGSLSTWRFERFGGRLVGCFAVNRIKDFLAMDGHILRCTNPQPDFIASYLYDGDDNVVVDNNALILFSGQYKHRRLSLLDKGAIPVV
jgi:hypothetical protein